MSSVTGFDICNRCLRYLKAGQSVAVIRDHTLHQRREDTNSLRESCLSHPWPIFLRKMDPANLAYMAWGVRLSVGCIVTPSWFAFFL